MYLATADGGRAITDAVIETYEIVNIGRALAGEPPLAPKDGARFHFELPGAVQGFQGDHPSVTLDNVAEQSQAGTRALAVRWTDERPDTPVVATTPTFIPPEAIVMPGSYTLLASPTLYPGQEVRARLVGASGQRRSGRGPAADPLLRRSAMRCKHSRARLKPSLPGRDADPRLAHS